MSDDYEDEYAPEPTLAELPWLGRAHPNADATGWPRFGVRVGGNALPSDIVPEAVLEADAMLAAGESWDAITARVRHLLRG